MRKFTATTLATDLDPQINQGELERWSFARSRGPSYEYSVDLTRRAKWIRKVMPTITPYASPFRTIFLSSCLDLNQLNYSKSWFVRDGFESLSRFFALFPEPKRVKCLLLIHRHLHSFVPKPWASQVVFYKFAMNDKMRRAKPKHLLLTGLVSENACSIDILSRQIKVFRKSSPNYRNKSRFYSFWHGFHSPQDAFPLDYFSMICRNFGPKLQLLRRDYFSQFGSLEDFEFIEFNDFKRCSDSFLQYLLLSRGAWSKDPTMLTGTVRNKTYIPLSSYHGIAY